MQQRMNSEGFHHDRVNGHEIALKVRATGADITAVGAQEFGRELGYGRRLRTPNLGWVFTAREADFIVDAIAVVDAIADAARYRAELHDTAPGAP